MSLQASASAKIILFGEHAVVYGQPAIAVPVSSLRATAEITPNPDGAPGLRIIAADLDKALTITLDAGFLDNTLAAAARRTLDILSAAPPDVTITLRSQIPMASGLGSGAAVTTALIRAISIATSRSLDSSALNEIVYEIEKSYHGTPSGIDNTVVVYEQPVYFVRGRPIETLKIGAPFRLLIGDTGQGALTKVAVGDVRRLYESAPERIQPLLTAIGGLVQRARGVIENGDSAALGNLMLENHALLQQLTVSSPELDRLVDAAVDAGALGAKLSGGGRGGNMIALVNTETANSVRERLLSAGAAHVFDTTVV